VHDITKYEKVKFEILNNQSLFYSQLFPIFPNSSQLFPMQTIDPSQVNEGEVEKLAPILTKQWSLTINQR
jgi:hypothetical protein